MYNIILKIISKKHKKFLGIYYENIQIRFTKIQNDKSNDIFFL